VGILRVAPGPRARILLVAALMFAAIFAARLAVSDPTAGLALLYVLPVVLVATELGALAGGLAGLLAVALFALWVALSGTDVMSTSYLFRAIVFAAVGAVTGHMADRLRTVDEATRASARHFELAHEMLGTTDLDGYLTRVNGSWEERLGWTRGELTSRPFLELVHPEDLAQTRAAAEKAFGGEEVADFTNRYRAKDGTWHWIEWSSKLDPGRGVIYLAARDVTEARAAEHARREAEERFRRAFEDSSLGMGIVGVGGEREDILLEANESLARMLGRPRAGLVGTKTLSKLAHPEEATAVAEGMRRLLAGEDRVYHGEFRLRRPDARELWVQLTASIVRDESGWPLYGLFQLMDVDARKRAESELRHLADHDPLSGLLNRRRFEEELERELAHSHSAGSRAALLLLDVDRFKRINDRFGHAAGDAVIARLGRVLTERLRSGDVVGRLGGDEFAVLLRRVDAAQARRVADELVELTRTSLGDVLRGDGGITLSIGVAAFGGSEPPSADELFASADRAMYDAKREGGGRASAPAEPVA
jgi:diguanylate cyclase (GGDEF)-like protein/PAS domain S-box-containing protein